MTVLESMRFALQNKPEHVEYLIEWWLGVKKHENLYMKKDVILPRLIELKQIYNVVQEIQ